jgi:Flp pilus assembly protein TadD
MLSQKTGGGFLTAAILGAIALLNLVAGTVIAQSPPRPIVVSGTVRNSAGEPIAGATVTLEDATRATFAKAQTGNDGIFKFSVDHSGTYTVRSEKAGWSGDRSEPMILAAGEKKRIELVMENTRSAATPANGASANSSGAAMELKDDPNFTVAGVTDWSNVGLHGSDTTSRTSETLAKETVSLKSGDKEKMPVAKNNGKYESALEYGAKGDFAKARQEVRRQLAASDDAEGHHLLGDIDERLNDSLNAVREYERAAHMVPSEQNYFDWGAELLLHKAAQPAVEVFIRGTTSHPNSARMLAGLGAALYAVGSYEDAARRLCQSSDLDPKDASPYLFLGQMEKTVATPLPCVEGKLAQFAQEQPANALANYYYAIALWKRQRESMAAEAARQIEALLEKATQLSPNFGEAYVQLGVVCFAQNDLARAILAFQQATKVSPHLSEAHYRLSLAYKRNGDEAKAHQEFVAYQQAEKEETAAVERQRSELKQFLVILKNQPAPSNQN